MFDFIFFWFYKKYRTFEACEKSIPWKLYLCAISVIVGTIVFAAVYLAITELSPWLIIPAALLSVYLLRRGYKKH